jgi:hypothetical protein
MPLQLQASTISAPSAYFVCASIAMFNKKGGPVSTGPPFIY